MKERDMIEEEFNLAHYGLLHSKREQLESMCSIERQPREIMAPLEA